MILITIGLALGCAKEVADHEVSDSAPCEFKEYNGVLTIEEIRPNSPANAEKDVLIIYQFEPKTENAPPHVKKHRGQAETTTEETTRRGFKPGKQFQTKAKYITQVFCSPGPYVDDLDKWQ